MMINGPDSHLIYEYVLGGRSPRRLSPTFIVAIVLVVHNLGQNTAKDGTID